MKELFLVDGYNIIFAWNDLSAIARESLEHAREKLAGTLAGYGKIRGYELLIVFDAMHTEDSVKSWHIGSDCEIIFTDKEETADSRIERIVYEHRLERRKIYVATSDGPEQNQVLGSGAYRISARELAEDVARARKEAEAYDHLSTLAQTGSRNEVVYRVKNKDVLDKLEEIRRSK